MTPMKVGKRKHMKMMKLKIIHEDEKKKIFFFTLFLYFSFIIAINHWRGKGGG